MQCYDVDHIIGNDDNDATIDDNNGTDVYDNNANFEPEIDNHFKSDSILTRRILIVVSKSPNVVNNVVPGSNDDIALCVLVSYSHPFYLIF